MFGFTARRVRKSAIAALSPMVKILRITSGLPKHFWDDPYVLGFLSGAIVAVNLEETGGQLKGAKMGKVLMDVLSQLSQLTPLDIGSKVAKQIQHPDFINGQKNADKMFTVGFGLPYYDDDPDVKAAKERAEQDPSAMASALYGPIDLSARQGAAAQEVFWFDQVSKRFPELRWVSGSQEEEESA